MDVKKTVIIHLFIVTFLFAQDLFNIKSSPRLLIERGETGYMQPKWSPDGMHIAFTSTNYRGLWVADSSGKSIRQLTDEPAAGFGFCWSPSSEQIVTRVARFEKFFRMNAVELLTISTQSKELLTPFTGQLPGVPHWRNKDEISFYNGKELITRQIHKSATLKKDRTQVFVKDKFIAVSKPDLNDVILKDPLKKDGYLNVVLSPNQKKIAFEIMGGDMYVMDVEGTNVVNLGRGYRPQWSPDSRYLVYMLTEDNGYNYTASDILIVDVLSGEKQRLTSTKDKVEMNPHWSPDGKYIAFDEFYEGAIYKIELEAK